MPPTDQEVTMGTARLTKLTGPQFEKWLNAFVDAFDMDSLRAMLRTKLGERLDTISKDGNLRVVNTFSKETINNIPINVYFDFSGYGCKFVGDERALTDESRKKMDAYIEFFPSDFDMADDLASAFKNTVLNELRLVP